mgnify:CR=1 FL=1
MTINEIRYQNLLVLIAEQKTAKALAALCGVSESNLSQIKNRKIGTKGIKAKQVGDDLARQLESGTGKKIGWMDREHKSTDSIIDPADYDFNSKINALTKEQRQTLALFLDSIKNSQ